MNRRSFFAALASLFVKPAPIRDYAKLRILFNGVELHEVTSVTVHNYLNQRWAP